VRNLKQLPPEDWQGRSGKASFDASHPVSYQPRTLLRATAGGDGISMGAVVYGSDGNAYLTRADRHALKKAGRT
jgi:hypothetical protein